MSTDEIVAEVAGLTKSYWHVLALRGIAFNIRRGEVLSLLGPNGAGKSTTIEILEGFRSRSSGEVRVLGEDPARAGRTWKARIGIVLQSAGLPEEMTVQELVTHTATFYPNPMKVDEVIARVGLEAKTHARIGSLSGGQKRRLDVALGIIGRPELLFLDEPTTGFDPEARHQFWDLITSLRESGTTILLTTHYLDEASHLSDRAIVIAGGRVVAEGAINEIGGREARIPIVRWSDDRGAHERRTAKPGAFAANLYASAGEVADLEIVRPTLEDIYLGIVAPSTTSSEARS